MSRVRPTLVATVAALGSAAAAYLLACRARCLHWGATKEEVERAMPGDDLLPDADVVATRAMTIDAPADAVWPWLVQMGSGRGGAYTYDWIENLMGLDMHSADEVLPELQDLHVGDVLPVGENGPKMRIAALDRDRAMVSRSEDGAWVWSFGLYPQNGSTRLVSRNRIALPGDSPLARALYSLVMEPGSLVMERKMLLGIKERAERLAA